jgi:MFS family permease
LLGLVSVMGMRFDVLLPMYAGDRFGGGPREFGALLGGSGIGAILGSLCLAVFGKDRRLGDWVAASAALLGCSLVLFSLSQTLLAGLVWMLAAGFAMVMHLDASNTFVQELITDEMRGRVMAMWTMMLTGLAPFGSLLAGLLAQHFGASRVLAAGGVSCMMGSMAFGFCLPTLNREARRLRARRNKLPIRSNEEQRS